MQGKSPVESLGDMEEKKSSVNTEKKTEMRAAMRHKWNIKKSVWHQMNTKSAW